MYIYIYIYKFYMVYLQGKGHSIKKTLMKKERRRENKNSVAIYMTGTGHETKCRWQSFVAIATLSGCKIKMANKENDAQEYVKKHCIMELFENLTAQLIYERPGE